MIGFWAGLIVMTMMIPVVALANPLLDEMDALNKAGGYENQKKAIELGKKAVEAEPDSYEANWRLARSYAYYTHALQEHLVPGWEDACRKDAKKGLRYAEKAMQLEPEKIEGCYFFAFNAGMYSFGISIVGAVTEGLKGKTQKNFEKVYAMDKNFEEGDVMISLARFWHQLPWPLKDMKESLRYYREYQASPFWGKDPNTMILVADLLADMGGEENKQEARQILDTAMKTCGEYYRNIGQEALNKL
ncbi:MAG: hypothetical protein AB1724_12350 [Thermodesulfobacteriota bacterium]